MMQDDVNDERIKTLATRARALAMFLSGQKVFESEVELAASLLKVMLAWERTDVADRRAAPESSAGPAEDPRAARARSVAARSVDAVGGPAAYVASQALEWLGAPATWRIVRALDRWAVVDVDGDPILHSLPDDTVGGPGRGFCRMAALQAWACIGHAALAGELEPPPRPGQPD